MQPDDQQPQWQVTHRFVEQLELERTCGLDAPEIDELVEYGALVPHIVADDGARKFCVECMEPLRQAAQLRHHYDLDLFAVGLVLGYLTRIERLEDRIRTLQANLLHGAHVQRDGPAPWREPHG